nr:hypothetical protein [uncultured Actinoplanes sp.]
MNNSRRIGAIMAMATATIGMTTATVTAPANAAPRGPEPVSTWLRPVRAHTDTWINIAWRSRERVCDASVRYYGRDVDVEYRGHRRSATFSRGVTLFPGRVDYTTIQVNPDINRTGLTRLRAVISYDSCGWKARPQVRSFTLTLPVQRNSPGWPGGGDGRPGGHDNGWPGGGDGRPGDHNGRPGDHNGRPGDHNGTGNGRPGHHDQRPPTTAPTTTAPTTTAPTTTAPTTTAPTTTAPTTTAPTTTAPTTTAPTTTAPTTTAPTTTAPTGTPPTRDGHQHGGDQHRGPRGNG